MTTYQNTWKQKPLRRKQNDNLPKHKNRGGHMKTRTEEDFGAEYAEELVRTGEVKAGVEVDEMKMCHSSVDIPAGDYEAMIDAGIGNPSARKYWRGYNRYMRGIA